MSGNSHRPIAVFLAAIWLAGCAHVPSFHVLGSLRLGIVVAVPALTWPGLTALSACALWLAFFQ